MWILGFLGILLLAFGIRVYNLTLLPVFADEAIYIRWSQIMANEATLRFLPLSDGKEPLFMWILMFLVGRFPDPLFIGRALSVFSGLGTMIGVGTLSFLLFKSKKASLIAVLLYTLSPFTVFFDRMALVDSMITMLGVWSFIFAVLTARTRRLDMAMILGFFLGLGMLTKSTAVLFMLLLPTTWLLVQNKKEFFKLIALNLVAVVIALGMFNILRLGPNFNLIASRNQDYVYPLNHFLTSPLDPLKGHLGGIKNYFYLMGPIGLLAIWLLGYLVNWKKHWKTLLILSAWAVGPILATAEYFKVVTARYIVYTIPFFIIIGAGAFLAKSKLAKTLSLLALFVFLVQAVLFDYKLFTNPDSAPLPSGERTGYLTEWTAGQGIKEISTFLKSQASELKPGDKIVVGTEGFFGTLPDGLQMYMQGVGNVTVIGIGLGIDKVPTPLVESRDFGNKTYLVVNKSRLLVNPEKVGLKLVASYQKPLRDPNSTEYAGFGPQDYLLFFEVK
jgi:4-amino-4-deoxy-L-arabinose transferase-like glycosyltransferase